VSSRQAPTEAAQKITAWICDECGYWRKEKSTGVHQTMSLQDPNGRLVRHELREAVFVECVAAVVSGTEDSDG
jgi:hypothetical protein